MDSSPYYEHQGPHSRSSSTASSPATRARATSANSRRLPPLPYHAAIPALDTQSPYSTISSEASTAIHQLQHHFDNRSISSMTPFISPAVRGHSRSGSSSSSSIVSPPDRLGGSPAPGSSVRSRSGPTALKIRPSATGLGNEMVVVSRLDRKGSAKSASSVGTGSRGGDSSDEMPPPLPDGPFKAGNIPRQSSIISLPSAFLGPVESGPSTSAPTKSSEERSFQYPPRHRQSHSQVSSRSLPPRPRVQSEASRRPLPDPRLHQSRSQPELVPKEGFSKDRLSQPHQHPRSHQPPLPSIQTINISSQISSKSSWEASPSHGRRPSELSLARSNIISDVRYAGTTDRLNGSDGRCVLTSQPDRKNSARSTRGASFLGAGDSDESDADLKFSSLTAKNKGKEKELVKLHEEDDVAVEILAPPSRHSGQGASGSPSSSSSSPHQSHLLTGRHGSLASTSSSMVDSPDPLSPYATHSAPPTGYRSALPFISRTPSRGRNSGEQVRRASTISDVNTISSSEGRGSFVSARAEGTSPTLTQSRYGLNVARASLSRSPSPHPPSSSHGQSSHTLRHSGSAPPESGFGIHTRDYAYVPTAPPPVLPHPIHGRTDSLQSSMFNMGANASAPSLRQPPSPASYHSHAGSYFSPALHSPLHTASPSVQTHGSGQAQSISSTTPFFPHRKESAESLWMGGPAWLKQAKSYPTILSTFDGAKSSNPSDQVQEPSMDVATKTIKLETSTPMDRIVNENNHVRSTSASSVTSLWNSAVSLSKGFLRPPRPSLEPIPQGYAGRDTPHTNDPTPTPPSMRTPGTPAGEEVMEIVADGQPRSILQHAGDPASRRWSGRTIEIRMPGSSYASPPASITTSAMRRPSYLQPSHARSRSRTTQTPPASPHTADPLRSTPVSPYAASFKSTCSNTRQSGRASLPPGMKIPGPPCVSSQANRDAIDEAADDTVGEPRVGEILMGQSSLANGEESAESNRKGGESRHSVFTGETEEQSAEAIRQRASRIQASLNRRRRSNRRHTLPRLSILTASSFGNSLWRKELLRSPTSGRPLKVWEEWEIVREYDRRKEAGEELQPKSQKRRLSELGKTKRILDGDEGVRRQSHRTMESVDGVFHPIHVTGCAAMIARHCDAPPPPVAGSSSFPITFLTCLALNVSLGAFFFASEIRFLFAQIDQDADDPRRFLPAAVPAIVTVLFIYLWALCLVSMLRTALCDPGFLPRGLDPEPEIEWRRIDEPETDENNQPQVKYEAFPKVKVHKLGGSSAWEQETRRKELQDGSSAGANWFRCNKGLEGGWVREKWCITCESYRGMRTSHCRVCRGCVQGLDHHCTFLNNCIGRTNYLTFFVFLTTCFSLLIFVITVCFWHLANIPTERVQDQKIPDKRFIDFGRAVQNSPESLLLGLVCLGLFVPISMLYFYHIRLIWFGKTTIEQIRESTARKLALTATPDNPFPAEQPAPSSGPSPFSRGPLSNFWFLLSAPQQKGWIEWNEWATEDMREENPWWVQRMEKLEQMERSTDGGGITIEGGDGDVTVTKGRTGKPVPIPETTQ